MNLNLIYLGAMYGICGYIISFLNIYILKRSDKNHFFIVLLIAMLGAFSGGVISLSVMAAIFGIDIDLLSFFPAILLAYLFVRIYQKSCDA